MFRIFFVCIFNFRLPAMLRNARPPAKPARESSDAKPMADGQSEADGRGGRGRNRKYQIASRGTFTHFGLRPQLNGLRIERAKLFWVNLDRNVGYRRAEGRGAVELIR